MKGNYSTLWQCFWRKTEGFPGGSAGKESACNAGDPELIPGLGRYPAEGKGYPLHYSCLENSMVRGACRLLGLKESDRAEWLCTQRRRQKVRDDGGGREKRGKKGEKQIITVLCCKYLQDMSYIFKMFSFHSKTYFSPLLTLISHSPLGQWQNFNSFPSIHFHISS